MPQSAASVLAPGQTSGDRQATDEAWAPGDARLGVTNAATPSRGATRDFCHGLLVVSCV